MFRLQEQFARLMLVPRIRFYYVKARWLMRKRNLRFYNKNTSGVGENVVSYNLTAFDQDSAFGAGQRMNMLLYPLSVLFPDPKQAKILIIGPRTEDDVFLARALGFSAVKAVDLFSYSNLIDLGDMHDLRYADSEFDAVVLGWVLAYSSKPNKAVSESTRVLKPGGYFAIGWEWVADPDAPNVKQNNLNDISELEEMIGGRLVFLNDPDLHYNHHKSLIMQKTALV